MTTDRINVSHCTEWIDAAPQIQQALEDLEVLGTPGPAGPKGDDGDVGPAGSDATITIDPVVDVLPTGTPGTVTDLDGNPSVANLKFALAQGADGSTPTVDVDTDVTQLAEGAAPTVADTDAGANVMLKFGIPVGATGAAGTNGTDGITPALTLADPSVTILPAGSNPTVEDIDAGPDMELRFGLPLAGSGTGGGGYDSSHAVIGFRLTEDMLLADQSKDAHKYDANGVVTGTVITVTDPEQKFIGYGPYSSPSGSESGFTGFATKLDDGTYRIVDMEKVTPRLIVEIEGDVGGSTSYKGTITTKLGHGYRNPKRDGAETTKVNLSDEYGLAFAKDGPSTWVADYEPAQDQYVITSGVFEESVIVEVTLLEDCDFGESPILCRIDQVVSGIDPGITNISVTNPFNLYTGIVGDVTRVIYDKGAGATPATQWSFMDEAGAFSVKLESTIKAAIGSTPGSGSATVVDSSYNDTNLTVPVLNWSETPITVSGSEYIYMQASLYKPPGLSGAAAGYSLHGAFDMRTLTQYTFTSMQIPYHRQSESEFRLDAAECAVSGGSSPATGGSGGEWGSFYY